MRIAGIKKNDCINGEGIIVSLWFQGCPHRCPGCHNPETWDFEGGEEIDYNAIEQIIFDAIPKNGIQRNFAVLGGEPLCPENCVDAMHIIKKVKEQFPQCKIFLWTGYTIEEIKETSDILYDLIKSNVDVLIDGKFDKNQKDLTLPLCGSRNQRIWTNHLTSCKKFDIIY